MFNPIVQLNGKILSKYLSISQAQAWQRNQAKRQSSERTINFSRRLSEVKVPVRDAETGRLYNVPIYTAEPSSVLGGTNSTLSITAPDAISGRTKTPLTSRTGLEPSGLEGLKPYGIFKRLYVRILYWITSILMRHLENVSNIRG